jgi:hypothetical protein
MFGTLVICLPSRHEGGEVHLSHGGVTKIFNTGSSSKFDFCYLAWYVVSHYLSVLSNLLRYRYSDVTHEVKPVTDGYRFIITYNLVYAGPGTGQLAADLGNEKRALQGLMASWKASYDGREHGCPNMLAYMIEYKYTDANLRMQQLKGNDRLRVEHLKDVCAQNGFLVWLANIEYVIDGECLDEGDDWYELYWKARRGEEPTCHTIQEVHEKSLGLTRVVDLDGSQITENVPLNEDDIVQQEPFSGDPHDEDWSGPTGNQGVSATHFYHNTVSYDFSSQNSPALTNG